MKFYQKIIFGSIFLLLINCNNSDKHINNSKLTDMVLIPGGTYNRGGNSHQSSSNEYIVIILLIIILVGGGGYLYYYISKNDKKKNENRNRN